MKKLTIGLVMLALLAGPAVAQKRGGGGGAPPPSPEDMQRKRDAAILDQQYKDALKRSSSDATPTRVDPWANMRSTTETTKR